MPIDKLLIFVVLASCSAVPDESVQNARELQLLGSAEPHNDRLDTDLQTTTDNAFADSSKNGIKSVQSVPADSKVAHSDKDVETLPIDVDTSTTPTDQETSPPSSQPEIEQESPPEMVQGAPPESAQAEEPLLIEASLGHHVTAGRPLRVKIDESCQYIIMSDSTLSTKETAVSLACFYQRPSNKPGLTKIRLGYSDGRVTEISAASSQLTVLTDSKFEIRIDSKAEFSNVLAEEYKAKVLAKTLRSIQMVGYKNVKFTKEICKQACISQPEQEKIHLDCVTDSISKDMFRGFSNIETVFSKAETSGKGVAVHKVLRGQYEDSQYLCPKAELEYSVSYSDESTFWTWEKLSQSEASESASGSAP